MRRRLGVCAALGCSTTSILYTAAAELSAIEGVCVVGGTVNIM